jgi:hypothetical protein
MVVKVKLGFCFSMKSQAAFSAAILLPVGQNSQKVVTIGPTPTIHTYISKDRVGLNLLISEGVPVGIGVEICGLCRFSGGEKRRCDNLYKRTN